MNKPQWKDFLGKPEAAKRYGEAKAAYELDLKKIEEARLEERARSKIKPAKTVKVTPIKKEKPIKEKPIKKVKSDSLSDTETETETKKPPVKRTPVKKVTVKLTPEEVELQKKYRAQQRIAEKIALEKKNKCEQITQKVGA